jgi:hypothetical protein
MKWRTMSFPGLGSRKEKESVMTTAQKIACGFLLAFIGIMVYLWIKHPFAMFLLALLLH